MTFVTIFDFQDCSLLLIVVGLNAIGVLIKYYGFHKDGQSGSHLLLKYADGRMVTDLSPPL